jgi:hypothetical protein
MIRSRLMYMCASSMHSLGVRMCVCVDESIWRRVEYTVLTHQQYCAAGSLELDAMPERTYKKGMR